MNRAEKVKGSNMTFTVTALLEGIWFGLGGLLIPGVFLQMAFGEASTLELYLLRSIGIITIALAIGCWYARTGDRAEVKLMSLIMSVAKVGSTIVLLFMMIGLGASALGYISPILTAIMAYLNVKLYTIAA